MRPSRRGLRGGWPVKAPKLILFDYGQTLIQERYYDRVKGCQALLDHAAPCSRPCTAEELARHLVEVEEAMGRFRTPDGLPTRCEVHNFPFFRYLLESRGVELDLSLEEADRLFWDAAAPGEATEGIGALLDYLDGRGIATGVISNLSFSGSALQARIDRLIPNNRFLFVMATSEYVFRKPDPHIFQLALFKAGVEAEDAWYCGDSPLYDVQGAYAAGLRPVWFTGYLSPLWYHGGEPEAPHLRAASWSELQRILEELE